MVIVSAWKNDSGTGQSAYGLRIPLAQRQRYFSRRWSRVRIELPDGHGVATADIRASFWRSCPELRSAEIGKWLRASGVSVWAPGRPPRYVLRRIGEATFRVARRMR